MTVLIVATINIVFLVIVYTVFTRRVGRLEEQGFPEKMRAAMDGLLADFNRAAARNIDIMEDRIRTLQDMSDKADKKITLLEGALKRAEALERERATSSRQMVPPNSQSPGDSKPQKAHKTQQAEKAENKKSPEVPHSNTRLAAGAYSQALRDEQLKANDDAATAGDARPNNASPEDTGQSGETKSSKKKTRKKRRKPTDRQIRDLAENGKSAEAIASELGIPREEVLLKLKFLRNKKR